MLLTTLGFTRLHYLCNQMWSIHPYVFMAMFGSSDQP